MASLTALILAAGAGNRFKPIVTSKPLLPFCGRTLLDWVITDLKAAGIKKFIVVVSPKDKDQVKSYDTVVQTKPTGMAGAVLASKAKLSGPVIVVNADDLLSPSTYRTFVKTIKKHPDSPAVTGWRIKDYFPGGYLTIRKNQVIGIIEKPQPHCLPSKYLNLVLHYFPQIKVFLDLLSQTKSSHDDVYELALTRLLTKTPAALVKADGYFQSLKYPWQILDMTQIILAHRLKPGIDKTAKIHPTVVIEGPVRIEAGVKIMPYAIIKGPAYIGKNVVIGDHVLIRNSIIEAASVIGYKTEIARSYVGPNNFFHKNYVGDSVIESDSNLGSGATLANLRFDKKEIIPGRNKLGAIMAQGSQLGVNVSVMPGVSLGAKAIVGSGLVLTKPLEAGEFKKA